VPFRHRYLNVTGTLLVTEGATEWRRPDALPPRSFIYKAFRNKQVVHIQRRACTLRLLLGIGNRASQDLFDVTGHALAGEPQHSQRMFGTLPADQIRHQSRLLRRDARVAHQRPAFNHLRNCG
jgi:hypothetical protein